MGAQYYNQSNTMLVLIVGDPRVHGYTILQLSHTVSVLIVGDPRVHGYTILQPVKHYVSVDCGRSYSTWVHNITTSQTLCQC